jgi:hypothetical protein
MSHNSITILVGRRRTGKTTYAKSLALPNTVLISEHHRDEWKGHYGTDPSSIVIEDECTDKARDIITEYPNSKIIIITQYLKNIPPDIRVLSDLIEFPRNN